jgi:hypothetical protein
MRENALRLVVVWIGVIGFAAAAIVLAISIAIRVDGHVIPPCPVPNGVSTTSRLDDAPPSLARALTERVGEVVPVGAKFDATDIVWTGKNRRLIFIWSLRDRWVVATEHGGIVYNNAVFAFDISPNDLSAIFVEERVVFPHFVCSTASSLLAVGKQNLPAAPPKDMAR